MPRAERIGVAFDGVLTAAQANAPWAFERLYRAYAPAVAGYLRVQGAAEPDDLTSEVFLAVFARLASFSGDERGFGSWVFNIAHRRLVDERRRLGRRPATVTSDRQLVDPADRADPAGDALRRLADERVRRVCDRLPADQRTVLLMRLVGDLTIEQVAEALGRSTGAVKQLQRRGLLALRKILEREGVPL